MKKISKILLKQSNHKQINKNYNINNINNLNNINNIYNINNINNINDKSNKDNNNINNNGNNLNNKGNSINNKANSIDNKVNNNNKNNLILNSTPRAMQINMSTLSPAQKQLCIKLLAQADLHFQQSKNGFQAQLKINPAKLNKTTEFKVEELDNETNSKRENDPNLTKISPIKPREIDEKESKMKVNMNIINMIKNKENKVKTKESIHINNTKNNINKNNQHDNNSNKYKNLTQKQKPLPHLVANLYTASKKPLSKTVKINSLTLLQQLHPMVQLYAYPKRMTFNALVELIEIVYDKYWKEVVIGGKKAQENRTNRGQRNGKIKATVQTNFCRFMYNSFILSQKDKHKQQLLLINLIQSLNHYSYKNQGIQLFYNFLSSPSEQSKLTQLKYFLIIRAVLEKIYNERIIQKVSSFGIKAGVGFRLRMNPYGKLIEEQNVVKFIQVCGGELDKVRQIQQVNAFDKLSQQGNQTNYNNTLFTQMTQHMFYDQKKKKNFIQFHTMCSIFLKRFNQVENNIKICQKEEGCEQNNQTIALFINNQNNQNQDDLQLSFSAYQDAEEDENGSGNNYQKNYDNSHQVYHKYQDSFDNYQIVENEERSINERQNQNDKLFASYLPSSSARFLPSKLTFNQLTKKPQKQPQFQQKFKKQIYKKFYEVSSILSGQLEITQFQNLPYQQNFATQILSLLIQCMIKHDKIKWSKFLKSRYVLFVEQEIQLDFIEKLQQEYTQYKKANYVPKEFINKIFTTSYLRQAIVEVYSEIYRKGNY